MEISFNATIILILAIIIVLLVFIILKNNIKLFNINVLKGLLSFSGETHNKVSDIIEKSSEAKKILEWIQENINKASGDYVLTETINENAQIAARIYSKIQGSIIATCFFEEPDYGNGDYANAICEGTKFTRITLECLCPIEKKEILIQRLKKFECTANLVIIPQNVDITKIGGIFCKLPDKSYLVFIALNHYGSPTINKGLLFTGEIAEKFYDYYNSFIQ